MSGDVTKQSLCRLTYLPERDASDNGTYIAAQDYDNVYIVGGEISGITLGPLDAPLAIADGGTGQITAQAALDALLPDQTGNSGKALKTNGTTASWGVDTDTGITQLTGDVTAGPGSGSQAATLATVNSNVGTFGSSTAIPVITANGKGLGTAYSTAAVVAPAGTLTGTTLAANVVTSSLTAVGTLTNLTVTNPITGSITGSAPAGSLTGTTLAANVVNSSLTSVGTLVNLTVTNPITGSISGNAGTVTYSPATSEQLSTVDTGQEGIDAALFTPGSNNVLCPSRNLVCKYISATSVDIDADEVVLRNAAGYSRRFTTLNETLVITNSGVNGLDTGVEANSTWYHLWAIAKQDGTLDGVLSASATAPTLPADYVFYGYLGAVYNNSSGNFVTFLQRSNLVLSEGTTPVAAGTETNYTSFTIQTPTTATSALLRMIPSSSSGTNTVTVNIAPAGSGTSETYGNLSASGSFATIGTAVTQECPIETAQTLYYRVTGTNAQGSITLFGWRY